MTRGRGAVVWIPSGGEQTTEIPLWVWSRRDGQAVPVSGIPLVIKESVGSSPLARRRSDPNGQVMFQIKGTMPGNYEVSIDPQESAIASLAPPIQGAIASVNTTDHNGEGVHP